MLTCTNFDFKKKNRLTVKSHVKISGFQCALHEPGHPQAIPPVTHTP